MPKATIDYLGPTVVACDAKCEKAWGINHRPKVQLSEDEDDIAYLADDELGTAPEDPGTYEGGEGKPSSTQYFPNKWCVRACERCASAKPGVNYALPDFTRRLLNKPSLHPRVTYERCPVCKKPGVEVEHGLKDGNTGSPVHVGHCPDCGELQATVGYVCEDCRQVELARRQNAD